MYGWAQYVHGEWRHYPSARGAAACARPLWIAGKDAETGRAHRWQPDHLDLERGNMRAIFGSCSVASILAS